MSAVCEQNADAVFCALCVEDEDSEICRRKARWYLTTCWDRTQMHPVRPPAHMNHRGGRMNHWDNMHPRMEMSLEERMKLRQEYAQAASSARGHMWNQHNMEF